MTADDPAAPDPRRAWRWDGEHWQYPETPPAEEDPGSAVPAQVDATGQWVWDGSTWQPAP